MMQNEFDEIAAGYIDGNGRASLDFQRGYFAKCGDDDLAFDCMQHFALDYTEAEAAALAGAFARLRRQILILN
jgi:hypothetical protein